MSKQNEVLYLVVADNTEKAVQLMDAFTFSHIHDLSRVSRINRAVYFKDGRIFKFISKAARSLIVSRQNWNIYSSTAFEKEFLNDNK